MTEALGLPTLIVTDVDMIYRTYLDPKRSLRSIVRSGPSNARRRSIDVHAVKSVSFRLHERETLGIIGHNGAGKSSLLLGLAGLIEVQNGTILARSRPTLLSVGAILNPQLSGRRNLELGCLALGMSRDEISEAVPALAEFTGLDEFIDLPLKAYSAGMRARLTFAIGTVVAPDILLIDEALAVGDMDFRDRANERLDEIRDQAGSVVIVSHSLPEIERACDRVLWMDHGSVIADGSPETVLANYAASGASLSGDHLGE
jgi:teichoic acid transport system ATP-binding protein